MNLQVPVFNHRDVYKDNLDTHLLPHPPSGSLSAGGSPLLRPTSAPPPSHRNPSDRATLFGSLQRKSKKQYGRPLSMLSAPSPLRMLSEPMLHMPPGGGFQSEALTSLDLDRWFKDDNSEIKDVPLQVPLNFLGVIWQPFVQSVLDIYLIRH